ncbi:MAG: tyrosine-type recombinase/integrase [Acidimicrobiales bacterium]
MAEANDGGRVDPLAAHIEGLCEELLAAGWRPATVESHHRLLGGLSRWAAGKDLTEESVAEFFRLRREAGFTVRFSVTGMAPVLDRLRARGAIIPSAGEERQAERRGPDSEADPILAAYVRYMRVERRFAETTVRTRWDTARRFRCSLGGDLDRVEADDVTRFLLGEVRRLRSSGAAKVGDGVRAFLRFVFATDVMDKDLSGLALTVRARRQSPLPKTLDPATVAAILDSCECATTIGQRDFAILTVMVRLGMRAGEVAAMSLDDIDWDAAELVVHGKGLRTERLPLPVDVGEAIATWLRHGRPSCSARAVFVNVRTGCGDPMTAQSVARVSVSASRRVGCERIGSHRLRHTAASQMVRAGASLREIAQVLRHSSESTTAIYAKVDRAGLETCVQPWTGMTR